MAKKNKNFLEKEFDNLSNYLGAQTLKGIKWSTKKAFNIQKRIIINAKEQIKPGNIKYLFTSREKYIFFPVTILSTGLLIYHTHNTDYLYISAIGLFSYFYAKGTVISVQDFYRETIKKKEIAKLCKKYKYICEMFDNRVQIVKEQQNTLTIFSSDFTAKNLWDKKDLLEIKFNRNISNISRQTGNFKYININFKVETKFNKFYKFQDYIANVDIGKMKRPFLFGIREDRELLIIDFSFIKHMLISGVTGGGKSNLINMLLQSLFCYDNNVVCILVDFKFELEMHRYKNFRNCVTISKKKDFRKILDLLFEEMEERAERVKAHNLSDVNQYNKRFPDKKIPFIILIIDEIGDLKLEKEIKNKNEISIIDKLKKLLSIARALNVCVVMATQTPSAEILDTDIRRLVPFKISTNVGNAPETQKMTGVKGTKDLNIGEFMTSMNKYNEVYKSLLIRDEADDEEGLPECNDIYNKLEPLMTKDNEFLEKYPEKCIIASGTIHRHMFINSRNNNNNLWQLIKRLKKILLQKKNKYKPEVLADVENRQENRLIVKPFSNTVIECINRFRELKNNNKNSLENNTVCDKPANVNDINVKYREFLKVIFQFRNEKNYLPTETKINKYLKMNKYERENFLTRAKTEEFIKQPNKRFMINLNCERWNDILTGN